MLPARSLARLARTARPLTRGQCRLSSSSSNAPTKASTTTTSGDRVPVNDPKPERQQPKPLASTTNELPVSKQGVSSGRMVETAEEGNQQRAMQAPNRKQVWSRSQQPRDRAMSGPRFEQTMMDYQPQPQAAIDLIHKQPVRWTDERQVACDGGGGPLGHPRIFINLDKPQICWCTYCGTPFANNHHRKHLESLPSTTYPLEPSNDPAAVDEPQRVTDEPMAQR